MNDWNNKKIKYRRYVKEYYDGDTGEELNEEEFKNYIKIKTEYIKNYAGHTSTTTTAKQSRKFRA